MVRAPLVFGPKAPGDFGRLVASIQHGGPLPLGAIRNRRSLVSVWNLCDLLIACLTHPAAPGAPLLVADAPAVSTPELVRLCAEMLGVTARLWPVPVGVLRLAAAAAGREVDFMRLCGSLTVDDRDTRRRLGWAPPLDLRAGLRQSLRLGPRVDLMSLNDPAVPTAQLLRENVWGHTRKVMLLRNACDRLRSRRGRGLSVLDVGGPRLRGDALSRARRG